MRKLEKLSVIAPYALVAEIDEFKRRLEQVVEIAGGPGKLSTAAGISRRVLDQYRSGRSDPSRTKLVAIAKAANVSAGWLADGRGHMELEVPLVADSRVSMGQIRKFIWNIAETYWEQTPRRTKPDAFADKFLEMFDYLLTREDVKEDAASEVIQFGAEQLKRASGRDER